MPILVFGSVWVRQLRKGGDAAKRDRVNALLESGRLNRSTKEVRQ